MNSDLIFPCILLVFIVFREWQDQRLVNKLVDKIMSKNYYDYQVSGAAADTNKSNIEAVVKQRTLQSVQDTQLYNQDLGSLTGLV